MLRSEIYAVASLIGSVIVAVGRPLGAPDLLPLVGAATTTCVIRLIAIRRGWSAPVAKDV